MIWLKDLYGLVVEPPLHRQVLAGAGIFTLSALHIYGTYQNNKRSKRAEKLEYENQDLREVIRKTQGDHRETCSRRLLTIGEALGFTGNERISLYKYEHRRFVMLGRHSEHPDLRAPGRGIYPADIGVIGSAWSSGSGVCFVDDLPDAALDLEGYNSQNLLRFRIDPEVSKSMAMKSRTIAAFCLKDHGGIGRTAVVVFESLEAKRFTEAGLREALNNGTERELSLLLDILKPLEPSIDLAKEKGF